MAAIDLSIVWNAIVQAFGQVLNFCHTVLVFSIGGHTFSLLQWAIALYLVYAAINFFFGSADDDN